MSIRFLGPPPLPVQVRVSPLTGSQLPVVLSALCHGIPQASLQHHTSPVTIRIWIQQLGRGLVGPQWPWRTEKLAEWVLSQREQQLQVLEEDLLRAAVTALGEDSVLVDRYGWTVDFLLRHKLSLNPAHPDDFRHQRRRLPRGLRERSNYFLQSLSNQVHLSPVPPHLFGSMDEFSIFVDRLQFSAHSRSALQLSGSSADAVPVLDVVLSALSDGTFLPPLLFFRGNPLPVPEGFPDNVLLEARRRGYTDQERHEIWINKVWSPRVAARCNSPSLLMVDVHRGHLVDQFRGALSAMSTDVVFIPSGCSARLQPLHVCVTPVLRDFLHAQWIQLVSDGGLDGLGLDQLALTLACWFSEVCFTLSTQPQILHRSFTLVCDLKEAEDRWEEARMIQTLTEALVHPLETQEPQPDPDPETEPKPEPEPELELLLWLEEEKDESENFKEKERMEGEEMEEKRMKVDLMEEENKEECKEGEEVLGGFEGGRDQDSFHGFDND